PGRVLVLCAVFPDGGRDERWDELKRRLAGLPMDYAALLERHLPAWRARLNRWQLRLDDSEFEPDALNERLLERAWDGQCRSALIERVWECGGCLISAATAPGSLPCPLMGLWSGEYRAGWAFNMANINLEMIC